MEWGMEVGYKAVMILKLLFLDGLYLSRVGFLGRRQKLWIFGEEIMSLCDREGWVELWTSSLSTETLRGQRAQASGGKEGDQTELIEAAKKLKGRA